jgi:hypothetical protein
MQSRMRLLCKMNALDAAGAAETCLQAKFITLTYPRDLLPSWEWAKRQLDMFLTYLFRKTGKHALLWRMEFQEDGSMHFHLMLWYAPYLHWRWIAATWDGLIGNQVTPEDSASTEIRAMRSWRQTSYYVSKYIAKDSDLAALDIFHGRHWGARFWDLLPVHRVRVALSPSEGYQVRRWMKRLREAKGVRTRELGRALPFCHQSEAGLMIFDGPGTAVRMVRCLRGYTLHFEVKRNVTFAHATAAPPHSSKQVENKPKEGENSHGTQEPLHVALSRTDAA